MAEISYDELRRIQAKERVEPNLAELRPDFYPKVKELLQEMNLELKKKFSIVAAREYENTIKILRDVISKREQKILGASLNIARGDYEIKNYLKEEEELLNNIVKILKDRDSYFNSLITIEEKNNENEKIKVIAEMPSFIGSDMQTYGPYKSGDLILLPKKEAEILIRRNAAVKLEG